MTLTTDPNQRVRPIRVRVKVRLRLKVKFRVRVISLSTFLTSLPTRKHNCILITLRHNPDSDGGRALLQIMSFNGYLMVIERSCNCNGYIMPKYLKLGENDVN